MKNMTCSLFALTLLVGSTTFANTITFETQPALSCYKYAAAQPLAEDFDVAVITCMKRNLNAISRRDCQTLALSVQFQENSLLALTICRQKR